MITLPRILAGLGAVIALVGLLAFGFESCGKGREQHAEIQAAIEQGKAIGHAEAAKESDQKVADLASKVSAQDSDLLRLNAERDEALRRLANERKRPRPDSGSASPAIGAPTVVDTADARDEVIEADARLIQAQAAQITVLKAEVIQLAGSRDQWKLAFEAETRRSAGLQIALDAQKTVSGSGKWRGRIEGFAVGIALGFVGGRL